MTEEDEAFNEIERRSIAKRDAVRAAVTKELIKSYDDGVRDALESVVQLIKELRPAIMPLEGMGRGKDTQEWFDLLVKHLEEMKK